MNRLTRLLSIRENNPKDEEFIEEINSTEVNIAKMENDLLDWTIPRQSIKSIYSIGTFEFLQNYSIKTTEQTIALNEEHENIQLFSERAISEYRLQ